MRSLLALALAALGSACSEEKKDHAGAGSAGSGAGGMGGRSGAGGIGATGGGGGGGAGGTSAAGTGAGGAGGDPGPPFPGAVPCQWEGWYSSPWAPEGCLRVCVPDSLEKRVPAIVWKDAPEMCAGCRRLDTPWTGSTFPVDALHATVEAYGAPDLVAALLILAPGSPNRVSVVFEPNGKLVHARRSAYDEDTCGRAWGPTFSPEGHALVHYSFGTIAAGDAHQWGQVLPRNRLGELAITMDGRIDWGPIGAGLNYLSVSNEFAAVALGGVRVAEIASGKVTEIAKLPGAPIGEMADCRVAGRAVFFKNNLFDYREWHVFEDGIARRLLGGPTTNVPVFATDGTTMVWQQGRDPEGSGFFTKWKYDLYAAPYATDPAKLTPRLLMSDTPATLGQFVAANGWLSGSHYRDETGKPRDRDGVVVRLSDGEVRAIDFPNYVGPGLKSFPGEDELWMAQTGGGNTNASTILRVPYEALPVIQAAAPAN